MLKNCKIMVYTKFKQYDVLILILMENAQKEC